MQLCIYSEQFSKTDLKYMVIHFLNFPDCINQLPTCCYKMCDKGLNFEFLDGSWQLQYIIAYLECTICELPDELISLNNLYL